MKEHKFLTALDAGGGAMPYSEAVDAALNLGVDPKGVRAFLSRQLDLGRVSGDLCSTGILRLTDSGRIFLMEAQERELEAARRKSEQLQQLADQRAEEKRNKLDDRKFQLKLTLLSSALSFLAGLLVEYFTGIVDLLISCFG